MLPSREHTHLIHDPVTAGVIDDFLTPELYASLLASFPSDAHFKQLPDIGEKLHFNEGHWDFQAYLDTAPDWRQFYDRLKAQPQWLASALHLGAETLPITKTKFEFSILPGRGGFLHPHADTAKKLATMVLFFTEEAWPDRWGGGLEFYRHKSDPFGDFTEYKAIDPKELELLFCAAFKPNRAVAFVRSPWSLHGVPPLKHPQGYPRRSITINFLGD